MSGSRARRVRRNKALKAMYCPNGRMHGPEMSLPIMLRWYYAQVANALRESGDPSELFGVLKPYIAPRQVTFPMVWS